MTRTYHVDRIDDESSEQLTETVEATDDGMAKAMARTICLERGWDAAEIWDKDADMFIAEVRA